MKGCVDERAPRPERFCAACDNLMAPSNAPGRRWLHRGVEREIPTFIITTECKACDDGFVTPAMSAAISAALDSLFP